MEKKKSGKLAINYTPVGKSTTLIKEILETIPPQFRATQKTGYIFSTLFLLVIVIGIINSLSPLADLDLSFDTETNVSKAFELKINVGIPLTFFGSDTETGGRISVQPFNFIIDIILYLLIAYLIDVVINYVLTLKLMPSKKELQKRPKEIQIQKRSMAEKATEKIVEKVAEKVMQKQQPKSIVPTTNQKQRAQPTTTPQTTPIQNQKQATQPTTIPKKPSQT